MFNLVCVIIVFIFQLIRNHTSIIIVLRVGELHHIEISSQTKEKNQFIATQISRESRHPLTSLKNGPAKVEKITKRNLMKKLRQTFCFIFIYMLSCTKSRPILVFLFLLTEYINKCNSINFTRKHKKQFRFIN